VRVGRSGWGLANADGIADRAFYFRQTPAGAEARRLAKLFQYIIKTPVSLARQSPPCCHYQRHSER